MTELTEEKIDNAVARIQAIVATTYLWCELTKGSQDRISQEVCISRGEFKVRVIGEPHRICSPARRKRCKAFQES